MAKLDARTLLGVAEHVFEEIDMNHVRQCAALARAHWTSGVPAFEVAYMPGDGTHYGLLFTILRPTTPVLGTRDGSGGSGDMGPYTIAGCRFDGTCAVVTYLQAGRSMVFGNRDAVEPNWILDNREGVTDNVAGALALALLFNAITEQPDTWPQTMLDHLRAAVVAENIAEHVEVA